MPEPPELSHELSYRSFSDDSIGTTTTERQVLQYYKDEMAKSNTMLYVTRISFAIFVVFCMYLLVTFVSYRVWETPSAIPVSVDPAYQNAPIVDCAANNSVVIKSDAQLHEFILQSRNATGFNTADIIGVATSTMEPIKQLGTLPAPAGRPDHLLFCFFNHSSQLRKGDKSFDVEQIPAAYCTHVVYYAAGLDGTFMIRTSDRLYADGQTDIGMFASLKSKYPDVLFLHAIGEGKADWKVLQDIASTSSSVTNFAHSVLKWTVKMKLDGVVINWNYPKKSDKDHLIRLMSELKASLSRRNLLVAITLPHEQNLRHDGFDVSRLSGYADFLLFSMFGTHNYTSPKTTFPITNEDVMLFPKTIMKEMAERNLGKACLILPVHGLSFSLRSISQRHIGAATKGSGTVLYNEICRNDWSLVKSELFHTFAVKEKQWVGYHDQYNLRNIMLLTKRRNAIRCFALWDVSSDDFRGACGERFPIVRTCYRNLRPTVDDTLSWVD
ncbi:chitinase-3-like protein 1 [Ornithodoros turicata]|uniref:chitinase-3-like protein 1 n=1 Tax=Ornithodoros turicata TaxID=34597 RepID=UPI003139D2F9